MVDKEWFSVLKHQKYPYDCLIRDVREQHKGVEKLFDIAISYQNAKMVKDENETQQEARWHFNEYQVESLYLHINDREDRRQNHPQLRFSHWTYFYAKEIEFHPRPYHPAALACPGQSGAQAGPDPDAFRKGNGRRSWSCFNDSQAEFPREATIASLFEQQAAADPAGCGPDLGDADRDLRRTEQPGQSPGLDAARAGVSARK